MWYTRFMDKHFSIKNVSELTGLSPSNIRYYESEGLITGVNRDTNGIRRFTEKEIEWIRFLGKLKDMEMPIAQMKQYAIWREQGDDTIKDRVNILEQHKQFIIQKIDRLFNNIRLLDDKIEIYKNMEGIKHE